MAYAYSNESAPPCRSGVICPRELEIPRQKPPPSPPSPSTPSPPAPPPPGCGYLPWKGDNYCDDQNNNAGCDWDGGDCCGKDNNYCQCGACKCLDPAQQGSGSPPACPDSCIFPEFKGDDYCDDQNNVAGCEWDGGDCCGDNVNTEYCSACVCLDPNA